MLKRTKLLSTITALLMSASSFAAAGDMMVRMRAINIMPDEEGTTDLVNGTVHLQSESVPEIDFTYFITDSIGVEVIAGTATHSATLYNAGGTNYDLGEVSLLPPTVTLQYHLDLGAIKPYIGAGLNYTFFYGGSPGTTFKSVEYDNSFGWAAQVGADVKISDKVYLNFDVKRIAISTDVEATLYSGAVAKSELDINPYVVGLGVGYQF